MNTKLIKRLVSDKFGRLSDEKQTDLKGLYREEGLFANQDEWVDALDIYFDDCISNAYDAERFA